MELKVRDLQVGDILAGSGAEVVKAPFDSVRCPKGKTNLVVRYRGGEALRGVVWGKDTSVKISNR